MIVDRYPPMRLFRLVPDLPRKHPVSTAAKQVQQRAA